MATVVVEGTTPTTTPPPYALNDLHPAIQSTGRFAGTPAIFIQLQGCDVRCAWCNVPETWQLVSQPNPDWKRPLSRWSDATVTDVVAACAKFRQRHVVVTGGEPLLHDVRGLIEALQSCGYVVQLETSGTRPIPALPNVWVTVAPKFVLHRPLISEALRRADEIVFPLIDKCSLPRLQQEVIPFVRRSIPIYLHVIGSARLLAQAATAAFQYNYRLTAYFDRDSISAVAVC